MRYLTKDIRVCMHRYVECISVCAYVQRQVQIGKTFVEIALFSKSTLLVLINPFQKPLFTKSEVIYLSVESFQLCHLIMKLKPLFLQILSWQGISIHQFPGKHPTPESTNRFGRDDCKGEVDVSFDSWFIPSWACQ